MEPGISYEPRSTGVEYTLALVPVYLVAQLWERILPILKEQPTVATPYFVTPEQTLHLLIAGKAQLWVGGPGDEIETVGITSIMQYPSAKTLYVNYIGGRNVRGLAKCTPQVEAYARSEGCTHMEFTTVPAVMRLLRRYGYRPLAAYTCKALVNTH